MLHMPQTWVDKMLIGVIKEAKVIHVNVHTAINDAAFIRRD